VLLDACALITWIKGEPEVHLMDDLFDAADSGNVQIAGSTVLLAEVYKKPAPGQTWGPRLDMVLARLKSPKVMLFDVTAPVALRAADYRRDHRLKAPDALHLATAALNRCDWLVTFDTQFPVQVGDVRVYNARRGTATSVPPWSSPQQPGLL